jgi:glucokinase
MSCVLAGDVGGTKTVLCLYQSLPGGQLRERRKAVFPSGQHAEFADLVTEFLHADPAATPATACFGIAGPIRDQRCETTNLPWVIDARQLAAQFGFKTVRLLNDLEAAAYGMLQLAPGDFVELNPEAVEQTGHKAVIAAGTGLGEAILAWTGTHYLAMPTEGGHTDFAPNNAEEDALLVWLRERFGGHVSGERILAGDGFGNLYDFLKETGRAKADPAIEAEMASRADRNAVISQHGLLGRDPLCRQVMTLFVRIYGSEAGNLALKCLPHGGLYIGGGIGPKIRPALEAGFMPGFLDKGRMTRAIAHTPVRLALNAEAPLLGAAHLAAQLAAGE